MNELAPQLHMGTVQVAEQRPEIHTEVLDRNPQPRWLMREIILPAIAQNPYEAYSVVYASESGGGKGTTSSEQNAELMEDDEFQGMLEEKGLEYQPVYASTANMLNFGIRNGLKTSSYGNTTTDEIDLISRVGDRALKRGEVELPKAASDKLYIFWDEFAGVSESLNAGTTTVKRLGRDPHAVVLFMVSNIRVQKLAYEERYELWQAEDNLDDVLHSYQTVLDVNALAARGTMGTHRSMEGNCAAVNEDMFVVYDAGKLYLPEETPYELRRDFEVTMSTVRDIKGYFDQLTTFADGKMEIAPIRPYLQEAFYYKRAEEWGFLRGHYHVYQPDFVEGERHGYPGKMAAFAFEWERYSQPELEAWSRGESI